MHGLSSIDCGASVYSLYLICLSISGAFHIWNGLFRADTLYAPGPSCPDDANNSMKLYAAYRKAYFGLDHFACKPMSFIEYCRMHHVVSGAVKRRPITGGGHHIGETTVAIGVRLAYEMLDLYNCQSFAIFSASLGSLIFTANCPTKPFSNPLDSSKYFQLM